MKARAFSRSLAVSMLTGITRISPGKAACSLASVGISVTQGAHQVAQRLTTTTGALSWVRSVEWPLGLRIGRLGGAEPTAVPFRSVVRPVASEFSSVGPPCLMRSVAMTYGATAGPIAGAAQCA